MLQAEGIMVLRRSACGMMGRPKGSGSWAAGEATARMVHHSVIP